jgi:hypothetical protein
LIAATPEAAQYYANRSDPASAPPPATIDPATVNGNNAPSEAELSQMPIISKGLCGQLVSSLHRLKDVNNEDAGFFIFPDTSVRLEGVFRLRFTLYEIRGKQSVRLCSVHSDAFTSYPPRSFPGMSESTFLSRSFSDQGVRIRIRKESRYTVRPAMRRTTNAVIAASRQTSATAISPSSHTKRRTIEGYTAPEPAPKKVYKHTSPYGQDVGSVPYHTTSVEYAPNHYPAPNTAYYDQPVPPLSQPIASPYHHHQHHYPPNGHIMMQQPTQHRPPLPSGYAHTHIPPTLPSGQNGPVYPHYTIMGSGDARHIPHHHPAGAAANGVAMHPHPAHTKDGRVHPQSRLHQSPPYRGYATEQYPPHTPCTPRTNMAAHQYPAYNYNGRPSTPSEGAPLHYGVHPGEHTPTRAYPHGLETHPYRGTPMPHNPVVNDQPVSTGCHDPNCRDPRCVSTPGQGYALHPAYKIQPARLITDSSSLAGRLPSPHVVNSSQTVHEQYVSPIHDAPINISCVDGLIPASPSKHIAQDTARLPTPSSLSSPNTSLVTETPSSSATYSCPSTSTETRLYDYNATNITKPYSYPTSTASVHPLPRQPPTL